DLRRPGRGPPRQVLDDRRHRDRPRPPRHGRCPAPRARRGQATGRPPRRCRAPRPRSPRRARGRAAGAAGLRRPVRRRLRPPPAPAVRRRPAGGRPTDGRNSMTTTTGTPVGAAARAARPDPRPDPRPDGLASRLAYLTRVLKTPTISR